MSDLIISTLTQGLIYALLSYGVYITYSVLDFPDLTVDSSFPLGAAVTAVLLLKGWTPGSPFCAQQEQGPLPVCARASSMCVWGSGTCWQVSLP